MRFSLFAALLTVGLNVASAGEINVGGVSVEVPSPHEFAPVTASMVKLYEFQKQFVAPTNHSFINFIPMDETAEALSGELPAMERRFSVQTAKSLLATSVSNSEFEGLKSSIKAQNAEILSKVEAQLPDLMGGISDGLSKNFDVKLALSVSEMLPLPVHLESNRALAYSAVVNYDMTDANGEPFSFVVVVTTAFVHVKGRVLFLYSYAGENDLQWSRAASTAWVNSVVEANPSDISSTMREAMPGAVSGINWSSVAAKAIVGAIIGLLIGLASWVLGRRKSS